MGDREWGGMKPEGHDLGALKTSLRNLVLESFNQGSDVISFAIQIYLFGCDMRSRIKVDMIRTFVD